jgi:hypothetical protein
MIERGIQIWTFLFPGAGKNRPHFSLCRAYDMAISGHEIDEKTD